ncbi:hypothetical protein [Conexibacter woesei]|uniref:Uncharacterized protein n=1 Tax=Conexibacter woesei (strain DSM 14684 / CCUG 47730 / CIP 108061 / JCM 11494 / NBRC 100937 / ID131577) TaxID=469383 RepID=D3F5K9_CONWI|nr:hypothetical protein [Conexibacter woesei]ADB50676.1 hypothetical protein Cwoe_2251 [Conexibacter woesei DSM 14684]
MTDRSPARPEGRRAVPSAPPAWLIFAVTSLASIAIVVLVAIGG